MTTTAASPAVAAVPQVGSLKMPPWERGELPDAPKLTPRSWALLLGPGLVMGGAAIGGGEWLAGPLTTARYGGAILWLCTLSILTQVVYNLEISRYTLYCGEPIFTGKFRLPPGPVFWLVMYIFLDFGSLFPYLAANAATPLAAVMVGEIPDLHKTYSILGLALTGQALLQVLKYVVFLGVLCALIFGAKVYNSLKAVMTFKIGVVLGFLTFVALLYSKPATWAEICSGFLKFGSVPVVASPGAPPHMDNFFVALWQGRPLPPLDLSMVAVLGALAAISGCGGLTNTTVSGYTRDQGWGMGKQVGAIPSVVGGRNLKLSHVGKVFDITGESVARFHRWYRFIVRDQLCVWMPACFIGIALPSMLSVQFLPRGTVAANDWVAAGMTADGLRAAAGPTWGQFFWLMTLFCGFLVLAPSAATTADGVLRRWVDVCWTAIPRIRKLDEHKIRFLYFAALCTYACFGVLSLTLWNPKQLLNWAGNIYNAALGFSCFHVLAVNVFLLPKPIRPNWFIRISLVMGGMFFTALSVIATLKLLGRI